MKIEQVYLFNIMVCIEIILIKSFILFLQKIRIMKLKLLISAFLIIFSINMVNGQAAILVLIFGDKAATENFYFSLKGGLNYSGTPGLNDFQYKPGFHFGLSNNIRINDKWYFVPEFLPLNMKGAQDLKLQSTGNPEVDSLHPTSLSMSGNLNYLDIPLLMRYKISKKINLEFGPQISFLLSANNKYKAEFEGNQDLVYTTDQKSNYHSLDYGFTVGLGYVISDNKNSKAIEVYLRYYEGFKNISKMDGLDFHNRVFQVSVCFPFLLDEDDKKPE